MFDIFNENTYEHYIIKYKTPREKKGQHEFTDYTTAKEIYAALTYNLTIKSAKLYRIEKNNKKKLLEKFKKYEKLTIL